MDSGRKRFRDDDDSFNAAAGFGEHRNKRLQSLPLRSSPKVSSQSLPFSNIVPLNANPAEAVPPPHLESWPPYSSQHVQLQQDVEVDMMDTGSSPPLDHDQVVQSEAFPHHRSTGRTPTPIQQSFAIQVRGPPGGWTQGQTNLAPNGIVNLGHQVTGLSQDQTVPRAVPGEAEWHTLQNHRPDLPSPISELGGSVMTNTADSSAGVVMDGDKASSLPLPPSRQCAFPGEGSTHAMEHPNAVLDVDGHFASSQHSESDADPTSPSPGRKGHQRSKHTVNSWTWQPGMKKSFSIGYRSDCEKCRLKVPGHFNHIVIS